MTPELAKLLQNEQLAMKVSSTIDRNTPVIHPQSNSNVQDCLPENSIIKNFKSTIMEFEITKRLLLVEQPIHGESKKCSKCGATKPISAFRTGNSIQGYCKPCFNLYQKELRSFNRIAEKAQCAICLAYIKLVLDHDHTTGQFRGNICRRCNSGIAMFRDDIEALKRAIDYLTEK